MSLSKTSNLEKGLNIVVFFCSSLRVLQITLDSLYTTLEALCLSIASLRGPVTLLPMYRPGSSSPIGQCLEELPSILDPDIPDNLDIHINRNIQLINHHTK